MCFHWCTHLCYGHKLTGSYLSPCAFSGATEPASVSHDQEEKRQHQNMANDLACSHALRASGSPGTLPLGRPWLRVRVRTVRITQIPWDGATHLPTDKDGVRQGHRSNSVKSSTACQCQPADDRDQTALTILSPSPVQATDRGCKSGRHPLWHCKFPQVPVTSANLDTRLDMGV